MSNDNFERNNPLLELDLPLLELDLEERINFLHEYVDEYNFVAKPLTTFVWTYRIIYPHRTDKTDNNN